MGCLTLYILIGLTTSVLAAPSSSCGNKPADIVFILDSSASIYRKDFDKQTAFVNQVVSRFNIGPNADQTRVGITLFGHNIWPQFNLNDKMDPDSLKDAINNIRHQGGSRTNTGGAINYALDHMFKPYAGKRNDTSSVAIVITDGRSQRFRDTERAAERAHKEGIIMFAIGVGKRLDTKELQHIASDPDTDHLFMVDDFTALDTIITRLAQKTCEVTQAPTTTTTTVATTTTTTTTALPPAEQAIKDCGGKPADVFFVVDSSGSIQPKDFARELDFVRNVIDEFDIGSIKTRIGVMTFSNSPEIVIPLDNDLHKDELLDKVSNIRHIGGGTNTALALQKMRREGFATGVARPEVPHIAVVLTDGLSVDEEMTTREANLTHLARINVFAIGIGSGVDLIEIKRIASQPDDSFVFTVNDFASLDSIKDLLSIRTCGVKPDEITDKPTAQPVCDVLKETDMVFIYDTTAVGAAKSSAISRLVSTIVSHLDVTSGKLHVGRVTDNCPSGGNFQLSSHLSSQDFASVQFSTYARLIKKVRRSGFNGENGGRAGATNVGVIFIDSDMDTLDSATLSEAEALAKDSEVFIVAVGQSGIIDAFAESFPESSFIRVASYSHLHHSATELLNKLCFFIESGNIGYVQPV